MSISASPQLTRQGVSGVPDIGPLRDLFAASGRLMLPGLVSTDVIDWHARCRAAGWWLQLRESPGLELLEHPDSWNAMHALIGSRSFLDIVCRISSGVALACFRGDTFRLMPSSGRVSATRRLRATGGSSLGLLVNLDRSSLTLEFPVDPEIWNRQQRLHSGDALLYRSSSAQEANSPRVVSDGPNALFHGWFQEGSAGD